MPNLLEETIEKLKENDKSPDDVAWVGSCDGTFVMTWDAAARLMDVEYDNDYGSYEVPLDLVVVGDRSRWWMERREYDGAEWWEFRIGPKPKRVRKTMVRIIPGKDWGLFPNYLHDVQEEASKYAE